MIMKWCRKLFQEMHEKVRTKLFWKRGRDQKRINLVKKRSLGRVYVAEKEFEWNEVVWREEDFQKKKVIKEGEFDKKGFFKGKSYIKEKTHDLNRTHFIIRKNWLMRGSRIRVVLKER